MRSGSIKTSKQTSVTEAQAKIQLPLVESKLVDEERKFENQSGISSSGI